MSSRVSFPSVISKILLSVVTETWISELIYRTSAFLTGILKCVVPPATIGYSVLVPGAANISPDSSAARALVQPPMPERTIAQISSSAKIFLFFMSNKSSFFPCFRRVHFPSFPSALAAPASLPEHAKLPGQSSGCSGFRRPPGQSF